MSTPLTLVVNADDLGLSAGINRGIERCFRAGILRSASLMPNGAAFADALELAGRHPGLGVGVHLSLVDEPALAPREKLGGLVDAQGRLPRSYRDFVRGFLRGRFGKPQVAAEIEAQLARVLAAGLHPTHLDSHQHLHLLPSVLEIVRGAAREAGIAAVRVPDERGAPAGAAGLARRMQLRLLGQMARQGAGKLEQAGLRHADRFWGLAQSGSLDEPVLLAIIQRLVPGVNELMCHPGCSDPATAARYQWGYHWDEEAAALCAEPVRQVVQARGIRLCTFAEAWEEK
jgi:hopanoid biosynthesis associated protein HpnK